MPRRFLCPEKYGRLSHIILLLPVITVACRAWVFALPFTCVPSSGCHGAPARPAIPPVAGNSDSNIQNRRWDPAAPPLYLRGGGDLMRVELVWEKILLGPVSNSNSLGGCQKESTMYLGIGVQEEGIGTIRAACLPLLPPSCCCGDFVSATVLLPLLIIFSLPSCLSSSYSEDIPRTKQNNLEY